MLTVIVFQPFKRWAKFCLFHVFVLLPSWGSTTLGTSNYNNSLFFFLQNPLSQIQEKHNTVLVFFEHLSVPKIHSTVLLISATSSSLSMDTLS